MQRSGMSVPTAEGNKNICRGRAKGKTHCGERRSQRTGEGGATPHPSHTPEYHQAARTGSQVPKNCRLKPVFSIKFWEDQQLEWESRDAARSRWQSGDILLCFHPFSISFSKRRAIFTRPERIAFIRNVWEIASSPHNQGKTKPDTSFLESSHEQQFHPKPTGEFSTVPTSSCALGDSALWLGGMDSWLIG